MKMKYVRIQNYGFVIWPKSDKIHHRHIGQLAMREGVVISAGFCTMLNGKPSCYGRSESLNIGGLPDDSKALAEQLGFEV